MNDPTPIAHAPGNFVTTRWTLVLRAQGESSEARLALGELCEAYWLPVFRFLRSEGKDEDTARDLTQGFFARLLASGGVAKAEAGRTRFRSYLLGALKHFLADERKQSQRLKRGGGVLVESLDAPSAAGSTTFPGLQVEDPSALPPDTLFDREWALTVMQRALVALQREFDAAAKSQDFDVLKPWLVGTTDALSHREAAAQLKTTEGALKVAIHRFRKRFREIIRSELAQTVHSPAEVEEELRYLAETLASAPGS